jgi:hypothetical protein
MTLDQLTGRYLRLRQELSAAYEAQPRDARRIGRLASDLSTTAGEIASVASVNGATRFAGAYSNAINCRQAQAQLPTSESM